MDEPRARDDAGDGANGFADELVGGRKGIVGALLGEHRFAHAVVVEGDQRAGVGGKFCEGIVGLVAAAFPFEGEGHGGDDHHKGTCLASDARDGRSGTRSRATAETDADEDKLMAVDAAAQCWLRLEQGFFAELGITTGAQPFEQTFAQLNFFRHDTGTEHPCIGAQQKQASRIHAIERDPLEKVCSRATDADDFDGCRIDDRAVRSRVGDHGLVKCRGCGTVEKFSQFPKGQNIRAMRPKNPGGDTRSASTIKA